MQESKALTFPDELLHQLRARHPDEGAVRVVSHSSGQQCLPCAGGPVQQHTLWETTNVTHSYTHRNVTHSHTHTISQSQGYIDCFNAKNKNNA